MATISAAVIGNPEKDLLAALVSDIARTAAYSADLASLCNAAQMIIADLTVLNGTLNAALTAFNGHTHGGVSAGSGNTAAVGAVSSPAALTAVPIALTAAAPTTRPKVKL